MRVLRAHLSDQAHDGLVSFTAAHGVSMTGLIEAWGRFFAMNPELADEAAVLTDYPALVICLQNARRIDADRRARPKG